VVQAPIAHAVVQEVRTPLAVGVAVPRTLVAFGSDVVFGSLWSDDGGLTWGSDPTLAEIEGAVGWRSSRDGKMFGVTPSNEALVYTLSTGDQVLYPLPPDPGDQMSSSWILGYIDATHRAAYDFVNGVDVVAATPFGLVGPAGSASAVLGPSGALVWRGDSGTSMTSPRLPRQRRSLARS
jgi:hypothetical protein